MPIKALRAPKRKITTPPPRNGFAKARLISAKREDQSSPFMGLVKANSKKLQMPDPFSGFYSASGSFSIIEPKLPFAQLIEAGRRNSALNQCVDAYVINIESYGYQLVYIGDGKEDDLKAKKQKTTALDFLDNINGEKSLRDIRELTRKDKEYTGNCYFEIGQDQTGKITFIDHIPCVTMRRTKKDKEATTYTMPIRTSDGRIAYKEWTKNFCRFVQISATGGKIFFKEFGDPRSIDPKTGEVNPNLAPEDQATAVFHHSIYAPGEAYGMPRWIGALPAMLGLRESELVNLNFFRENAIPAMAVLISGGALTQESFEKVTALFSAAKGRDAMNRILILEAAADESVGNADQAPPVPKIDMKPMISERQSDGLFKEFEDSAKKKVRSSMRLPAIFTGDSEEYTKATAQSGQRIAESQVFFPERSLFDEFVNRWILPSLGITLWRFKTMGPTAYDPDSLGTLIDRFARHGAITPNVLVQIANQVLDVQIPPPNGKWGDVPFMYSLAMVAGGAQLDDFEDTFALINDATGPDAAGGDPGAGDGTGDATAPANGAPAASNDNGKAKRQRERAFRAMIRRELHSITNDIINQVNENLPNREAA